MGLDQPAVEEGGDVVDHGRARAHLAVRDLRERVAPAGTVARGEVVRDRLLPDDRMFAANTPLLRDHLGAGLPLITQTSTSGGSSETDENAVAVMPKSCASPRVVITVTPVAKAPSVFRNSLAEKPSTDSWCLRVAIGHVTSPEALADDAVELAVRRATGRPPR